VNARTFHLENLGIVREGFLADLIAVQGNPLKDIKMLREVSLVMLNGTLMKTP
jgi:imidazolonepropionase-like amidohydrolase